MATTIHVEGMACGGCESNVVEALEAVSGVTDATADHEEGTASATGDADADALVAAIEDAGYDATHSSA
jgi:copper chaperone